MPSTFISDWLPPGSQLIASSPLPLSVSIDFTILINLLGLLWLLAISALVLVKLPGTILGQVAGHRGLNLLDRHVHGFVRLLCLVILGTLLWARLGLFTWFTALLTYVLSLLVVGCFGNGRQPYQQWQRFIQGALALTVDLYDRGVSWRRLRSTLQDVGKGWGQWSQYQFRSSTRVILLCAGVVVALGAMGMRFYYPLHQWRFSIVDSYGQLLATQQILSRDVALFDAPQVAVARVPVLAAISAFMAIATGLETVQTQHFTMALVGCWLVGAVGYLLWQLTRNAMASVVGAFSLGSYLFSWSIALPASWPERLQIWLGNIITNLNLGWIRQWNPNEVEVAALFLLLGLGAATHIASPHRRLDGWISTICCWLIVAIAAPPLLGLMLVGGFGLILGRQIALLAVVFCWLALALLAAMPASQLSIDPVFLRTLPIALALASGLVFYLVSQALRGVLGLWTEPLTWVVVVALAVNFFLPHHLSIDYVEYEVSARKAVEIATLFPYKNWTLVAPSEQLAQSYRRGWYVDLAQFVADHGQGVQNPAYRLPLKTRDIFVLVEKRAFGSDRPEPEVPYSTLQDPAFQSYRSPTGRKHLEAKALELCEAYARNHPDSRVYYENELIKIFQFSGQVDP